MRIVFSLAVLTLCLLSGCFPEDGEKTAKKKTRFDPANFSTYRADDKLVEIGTNSLTKSDIERLVNLRIRILRFSLPPSQRDGMVSKAAVQVPILANAVDTYRAQTALLQWAATNGVTAGEEDLRTCERNFMLNCRSTERDFNAFLRSFSKEEAKTARERVRIEALMEKVRERVITERRDEIKPLDASLFIARITNYNHSAQMTNELVWARATNLWNQARNGADFAKLADENSEDETVHDGGEWGAFRIGDLVNDGDLDKVVANMAVGEISAPLEADNALNIIKLRAVTDAMGKDVTRAERNSESRYDLARIMLKLPEIYEVPTLEEAKASLKRKAEDDLMLKFVQKLMSTDGFRLPHGDVLFETARKASRMPMMFQQEGMEKGVK